MLDLLTAASPTRVAQYVKDAAAVAGPPLLFGVRLWASTCLALYVAFWLQLNSAFWAATDSRLQGALPLADICSCSKIAASR